MPSSRQTSKGKRGVGTTYVCRDAPTMGVSMSAVGDTTAELSKLRKERKVESVKNRFKLLAS